MTGILPYYSVPRKNAVNEHDQLGDTSTLADPAVVEDLVANRQNR
tara:strand:- start:63 stop:197 length:135 start_codon:yes stop_codon:yes gene_type:complete